MTENYSLTDAAKGDLREIYRYGFFQFGEAKADQVYDALFETFGKIARQPLLYQAVTHIHEDYRRCVHGSHSVYYRLTDDTVEIMRIIGQQDTGNL